MSIFKTNRRLDRRALRKAQAQPNWEDSPEAQELLHDACLGLGQPDEEIDYRPEIVGRKLPPEGQWIQVTKSPHTEYTVPPFSIWFATPWQMDVGTRIGFKAKRVQVVTPKGSLGLFPSEYAIIKDVSQFLGREREGVYLRQMNDQPVVDKEALFYLQSRGVPRQKAMLLLINQIKDPSFLWIEFAPQYGEFFGREWPTPEKCPFCTPRDRFAVAL